MTDETEPGGSVPSQDAPSPPQYPPPGDVQNPPPPHAFVVPPHALPPGYAPPPLWQAALAPDGPPPGDAAPSDAANDSGRHRWEPDGESAWQRYRIRRRRKRALKRTPSKRRRKSPWWELPALVGLAILIAIIVKTFLVQPFYIPSASMEKTLHGCTGCHGDRILVNKIIYDFRDPHPGDIVVFHAPPGWNDEPPSKPPGNPLLRVVRGFGQLIGFVPPDGQILVKRVIAIGGQTVWGVDRNGRSEVHVRDPNGHEHVLNEPYVYNDARDTHATFGPVTVPKGRLWVMGDHRSDSADSRYHCGTDGNDDGDTQCNPVPSTVPVSGVIGKAFVIAWPPSRWRTLGTPPTFENAALAGGPGLFSAGIVLPLSVVRRRRRR